jgi:hypothetical protein
MNTSDFQHFTEQLRQSALDDPQILGLVALGSMANLARLDAWSDHDFFLIVQPGLQEHYRQNLIWLPRQDDILFHFRETAHGLKVMYRNAHLIEFAVFDLEELNLARINDYAVLVDKTDLNQRMMQLQHRSAPTPVNPQREFYHFLSLLQVGAGRAARGEVLSGQVFIKTYALGHLLRLLVALKPDVNSARLDNLDSYRRFEQVFPEWGQELQGYMLQPPVECALSLLALVVREMPTLNDLDKIAVATIHDFLVGIQTQ